jgi:TMEM175 potassium channel family protein
MKNPLEPPQDGLDRLVGVTDGIFAIALTLIVFDIHVPAQDRVHSERELISAVVALAPRFLTYAIGFLTLTIFWFGQQAQHNLIARADRRLATLHVSFLGFIALLPFSTDLLADFIGFRTAIVVYWLNLFALGAMLLASWRYAEHNSMLVRDIDAGTIRRVYGRIVKAQIMWALGAALSIIGPRLSIGFIFVVQLVYAIGPRIGWLQKIIG